MGIDDRDYMRERTRKRLQGGAFDAKKHRFNYGSGRWNHEESLELQRERITGRRRRKTSNGSRFLTPGPVLAVAFAAVLVAKGLPVFQDVRRHGYLPDFATGQAFPESGEFKVRGRQARGGTARFTIAAGDHNAVVQLVASDGIPVFMTFVRMNEMAAVLAPHGTWTLRLIEGDTWYGEEQLFGFNTVVEDSKELMTFGPGEEHIIDLRRRFNGNLETKTNWRSPDLEGN